MRRQVFTALRMTVVLTVLLGLVYPLVMTGASQVLFKHQANGSLVHRDGRLVGSSLLGQAFTDQDGRPDPRYFQSRPSAAGAGYDGLSSGGSNLGPTNPRLLEAVADRIAAYRLLNGLGDETTVPVDAVTASASGLDPDISAANALIQARRVARVRGLDPDEVVRLVQDHIDNRPLGVLGEKTVNVLDLNLALDRLS